MWYDNMSINVFALLAYIVFKFSKYGWNVVSLFTCYSLISVVNQAGLNKNEITT